MSKYLEQQIQEIYKQMKNQEKIEDGYYYIKLPESEHLTSTRHAFEQCLPPTRCIYIKNHNWEFEMPNCDSQSFAIDPALIKSPAFKIGEMVEVRDNQDIGWFKHTFTGYVYHTDFKYNTTNASWKQCRKIPEPNIEINIKINGKTAKLSDISEQTLKSLRNDN